jgi:RNA polymerase-binding transcription factor
MAIIWTEEPEDLRMNTKKLNEARRRLSAERENIMKSISRNRTATEETRLENTEDEGDLATISHERELLYNLHESDFARLKFIQEALQAMDRGNYGECVRCGEAINDKRLEAVPWATTCIGCQEEAEAERTTARMVLAGMDTEETEF